MEPQARIGLAQLTRLAFDGVDLEPLRTQLMTQYALDNDGAGALMDLSVIDQLQGQRDTGLGWQAKAFESCRIFRTHRERPAQRTCLVFAAPTDIGGNTPVEFLLQGSEFELVFFYPGPGISAEYPLPAHDIAFCAGPADGPEGAAFRADVRRLTEGSDVPVLNLPATPMRLDRDRLSLLAFDTPGVRVPHSFAVPRAMASRLAPVDAPYLIRPAGSHAGQGLARIDDAAALEAYLAKHPDQAFTVTEYVDYASASDGQFRKYRIVFVDGRPYPCHMAISDTWDVWYMNAHMHAAPEKRAEEAAFMSGFDHGFADRHADALAEIARVIDLDYFGIDCAVDREGNLVVFEADNALIVHDMDCEVTFPYKRTAMRAIFGAVQDMLHRHTQPAHTPSH